VELPVGNRPDERRWVLIDGDAQYLIGTFDGTRFVPQTEKLKVDYGKALYAGQVWKRTPEGGPPAYQMFWMRYPNDRRLTWNGQMSFPVDLTLWAFPEGIRLCRRPIDEVNNLRVSQQRWRDVTVSSGQMSLDDLKGDLLDLRVELQSAGAAAFGMLVRGQPLRYSVADQTLHLGDAAAPLRLPDGKLRLQILVDRSSVEVFADRGQVTISAVTLDEIPESPVKFTAEGGKAQIGSLEANHLTSIWPLD
jgi:levanase/fructan beta-fructosidase